MWYTLCVCYPDTDFSETEDPSTCVLELIGGPLDGLVVEADKDDLVWTIPVFFSSDRFPGSIGSGGSHVYNVRREEPGRMFYAGVLNS